MGFWDNLYNSTIGKAVSTAENLWKAGTMPTTGNILQAGQQAGQTFQKLQTPSTHAQAEKDIRKAKIEAPAKAKALQEKQHQQFQDIMKIGTTLPTTGNIFQAFGQAKESYQKLQTPSARPTEEARLEGFKKAEEQRKITEFQKASPIKKLVMETGEGVGQGLIGKEPLPQLKTGNWWADTISNLVGQGIGFVVGGELTGGAALGGAAKRGLVKLAPMLEREGAKLIPRLASNIAKGAVRNGVEMEMLSGIHSVLNSDTQEQALQRAKDYGLMSLVGAGLGAGGHELLGAIAKKLKVAVSAKAPVEPLKGYSEPPVIEMPPVTKDVADSAYTIVQAHNDQDVLHQAGNILKNIVDNHEAYPASMVQEAKISLIDLHAKIENLNKQHGFATEIAGETKPTVPEAKAPEKPKFTEHHLAMLQDLKKEYTASIKGITDEAKLKELADKYAADRQTIIYTKLQPEPITAPTEAAPREVTPETAPIEADVPTTEAPTTLETPKSPQSKFMGFLDTVYQHMVDESRPIEKLAKQTGGKEFILATNLKNSSAITQYIFEKELVDKSGSVIGKSLKELAARLPKDPEVMNIFWKKILSDNVPPNFRNVGLLESFKGDIPAEYQGIADDVVLWVNTLAKRWGRKPSEVYDKLIEITPTGEIANPLELLITSTDWVVRTSKFNDLMVELVKSVHRIPDKLKPIIEDITGKRTVYQQNVIRVKMSNGDFVDLLIKDNSLHKSLYDLIRVSGQPNIFKTLVQWFKNIITVKNPLFALRNITKDVPAAFIKTGGEATTIAGQLKAPIKLATEIPKAIKESYFGGESKSLYESIGGGGNLFFRTEADKTAGELAGTIRNKITLTTPFAGKVGKAITWFNESAETVPRLAEFNRVLKETGDIDKALFAANEITVNFSRGGTWAKQIDQYVPYFNAGIQGLDNFMRTLTPRKALATLIKGGVIITAPKIVQWVVNHNNPNYDKLDTKTKDNYFIFPIGDSKTTENFIKIPASREFNSIFGALMQRAMSGEGFKGFVGEQSEQVLPPNPITGNILAGAMGAAANWDFYFESPIVSKSMTMGNVPKHLQFDDKTNKLIVKFSQFVYDKTGEEISPKMVQYLIKKYAGELGEIGLDLIPFQPKKAIKLEIGKWTTSTLTNAQPVSDFYTNLSKLANDSSQAKLTNLPQAQQDQLKISNNAMGDASSAISGINKLIATLDPTKDQAKIAEYKHQVNDITDQYNAWYAAGATGIPPRLPLAAGGNKQITKTLQVADFTTAAQKAHADYRANKTSKQAHDVSYEFTNANKAISALDDTIQTLDPKDPKVKEYQDRIQKIATDYKKWADSGATGTPPAFKEVSTKVPKLKTPKGTGKVGRPKGSTTTHKASTGGTARASTGTVSMPSLPKISSVVHVARSAYKAPSINLTPTKIKAPKISLPKGIKVPKLKVRK